MSDQSSLGDSDDVSIWLYSNTQWDTTIIYTHKAFQIFTSPQSLWYQYKV